MVTCLGEFGSLSRNRLSQVCNILEADHSLLQKSRLLRVFVYRDCIRRMI